MRIEESALIEKRDEIVAAAIAQGIPRADALEVADIAIAALCEACEVITRKIALVPPSPKQWAVAAVSFNTIGDVFSATAEAMIRNGQPTTGMVQ